MTCLPVSGRNTATSSVSPQDVANLLETVSSVIRYLGHELRELSSGCAAVSKASQARQDALLAGLRQAAAIQKRLAGLDEQLFLAGAEVWAGRCAAGRCSARARSKARRAKRELL
jgi:hypothetical protein